MALSINPVLPAAGSQGAGGATTGVTLQPGTVVNAQVESVLAGNLVRIAIANLSIEAVSELALSPGQNLSLAVSQASDGTLRLQVTNPTQLVAPEQAATLAPAAPAAPVTDTVAPNDPLSPLQRVAVSAAAQTAATRQQGLSPLFANLAAVASTGDAPPGLQQAIAQVLAQQTSLDPDLSGDDIKLAFQTSGLFLEANLASGVVAPNSGAPDLKAALIVLREALASVVSPEHPIAGALPVATAAPAAPEPDAASPGYPTTKLAASAANVATARTLAGEVVPATAKLAPPLTQIGAVLKSIDPLAVLRVLQDFVPEPPRAADEPVAIPNAASARNLPNSAAPSPPPPPLPGALPSPQPVAASSIRPETPLPAALHQLRDDTEAALARQTLLQIASLPDRVDTPGHRIDPALPRWNFEIPFATPQGTAIAQFEISRDGGGHEVEASGRIWQARFSLDVEPAGPVHALISLSGERTKVSMWAERPQTAAQLRAGAADLGQALSRAELVPGDIVIRDGVPPLAAPAKAGYFLDRAL